MKKLNIFLSWGAYKKEKHARLVVRREIVSPKGKKGRYRVLENVFDY